MTNKINNLDLEQAANWFKSRDIQSEEERGRLYIETYGGYTVEITPGEIAYRAELYREERAEMESLDA